MIYPTAAPFQDCAVPLIPNERGEHVNTMFLDGSMFLIQMSEHSYQWRLTVELPESRVGFGETVEVAARLRLVGRRLLEGKEEVWSHVGVDYDGEICYSYTFDGFPTEREVDNRLSEALSFFESYGYLLSHALLDSGDKGSQLHPTTLLKRAKGISDWLEALCLDDVAPQEVCEEVDRHIDDIMKAVEAPTVEVESPEVLVVPSPPADGGIDIYEDDLGSVVDSPEQDIRTILSLPCSWTVNTEHDDAWIADESRWPRWEGLTE